MSYKKSKGSVTNRRQGQISVPGAFLILRILVILCGLTCLGLFFQPGAYAQEVDTILIQPPELIGFPSLSFQVKLPIMSGQALHDLDVSAMSVFEDENPVQVTSFTEDYHGIHFTLVINGGREMDLRDHDGVSPYQKMSEVLIDWTESRVFRGEDAWSLVTSDGILIRNQALNSDWVAALQDYQPNFRNMEPKMASLEGAIQFAQERMVPFGVDKVLLYLTPPPTSDQIDRINNLASEARLHGIYVNVWMVGDEMFLDHARGRALISLADSTGGQFFYYNGMGDIPDPSAYLDQLGQVSTLTYQSRIQATGTYSLQVELDFDDGVIAGKSAPFYIEVHPPQPVLISPPRTITHVLSSEDESIPGGYSSAPIKIHFMVQFSDKYPREIVISRLYVDGRLENETSEPPFDMLTWDTSTVRESGEYVIQVEVFDSLGLSARTILSPVQMDVIQPESEPQLSSQEIGITVSGILLVLATLLFLVWLARRYSMFTWIKNIQVRGTSKQQSEEGHVFNRDVDRITARLIPLKAFEQDYERDGLQITPSKTIIGSDRDQADIVCGDVDIAPQHACLVIEQGHYWIKDLGSSSGTWLNETVVGTEPVQVKPGDLIYFGNLGFRFTIIDDEAPSKVVVTNYEPIL